MSLAIQNNKINLTDAKGLISFSDIKNSSQSSYAVKTDVTYTVGDELVLFINGGTSGTPSVTLTLPSPNLWFGRNLFVVQRSSSYPINVQASTFIDVDQDANGTSTQTGLLPLGSGGWVHLVSNGRYWVAVSKSTALPA